MAMTPGWLVKPKSGLFVAVQAPPLPLAYSAGTVVHAAAAVEGDVGQPIPVVVGHGEQQSILECVRN
jgi:hypothetical protein